MMRISIRIDSIHLTEGYGTHAMEAEEKEASAGGMGLLCDDDTDADVMATDNIRQNQRAVRDSEEFNVLRLAQNREHILIPNFKEAIEASASKTTYNYYDFIDETSSLPSLSRIEVQQLGDKIWNRRKQTATAPVEDSTNNEALFA